MSSAPASQPATPNPEKESELIYGLESHPPFGSSLLAALQHILAMVLSVMAPPAIVAGALGVPPEAIAYLVSMSLLFAGIGIWFQVSRPFGIGSGMLSIQATSFAFPGTLIAVGALLMKEQGMSWEQALSTLFGVCFIGGFVVMAGSRIMPFLRKIITPTVAGITVMMIGVSLVRVGAIDLAGGFAAKADGTFGDISNLFLGTLVILAIVCVNRSKNPLLRMSSLIVGILVGFAVAIVMGKVNWNILSEQHTWFIMPVPFKFGFFGFDLHSFLVLSFLFLVVVIEAIGDLTATSVVSEQPVRGRVYRSRLAGGIHDDLPRGYIRLLPRGDVLPEQRRHPAQRRRQPQGGQILRRAVYPVRSVSHYSGVFPASAPPRARGRAGRPFWDHRLFGYPHPVAA